MLGDVCPAIVLVLMFRTLEFGPERAPKQKLVSLTLRGDMGVSEHRGSLQ